MRLRWVMSIVLCVFSFAPAARPAGADDNVASPTSSADAAWHRHHDQLVERLRVLENKTDAFGPAYQPLYDAILPWYEAWGGRSNVKVDDWMVSPEVYVTELADALEHGRNYIAENPGSGYPLWFQKTLPDGRVVQANYTLNLPAGFPGDGRRFPLIVGLHGSGWIAHKISYGRGSPPTQPYFSVVPILEKGDWQIDFLNAYLDELLKILPVDPDRVYLEGHSLGLLLDRGS